MAFQSGTATSQEDLIQQFVTFAAANGWTQDDLDLVENEATIHKGSIYMTFRWDGVDADNIAIYQSLGYTGGNDPWNHPDDSGNGTINTSFTSERRVESIGNGPFTAYAFFQDTSPADSLYCVLEVSPGIYRHFGCGQLVKNGDWTGGEFVYGHAWNGAGLDGPAYFRHSLLLDGAHAFDTENRVPATIHAEGLPNMPGSTKWLNVGTGSGVGYEGTDRAGNPRRIAIGGARGGFHTPLLGTFSPSLLTGFVPLIPIGAWYNDESTLPDTIYYLGEMPNVRHVQMASYAPGEEITIGADTWVIYPGVRKRFVQDNTQESGNMGVAYKKVV